MELRSRVVPEGLQKGGVREDFGVPFELAAFVLQEQVSGGEKAGFREGRRRSWREL
jgi:hypothetical protein